MNTTVDMALGYYEHACGKDCDSLELMRGLFNCYARQSSFAKQLEVSGVSKNPKYCFQFSLDLFVSSLLSLISMYVGRFPSECISLFGKTSFCSGQFSAFNYRYLPKAING